MFRHVWRKLSVKVRTGRVLYPTGAKVWTGAWGPGGQVEADVNVHVIFCATHWHLVFNMHARNGNLPVMGSATRVCR